MQLGSFSGISSGNDWTAGTNDILWGFFLGWASDGNGIPFGSGYVDALVGWTFSHMLRMGTVAPLCDTEDVASGLRVVSLCVYRRGIWIASEVGHLLQRNTGKMSNSSGLSLCSSLIISQLKLAAVHFPSGLSLNRKNPKIQSSKPSSSYWNY